MQLIGESFMTANQTEFRAKERLIEGRKKQGKKTEKQSTDNGSVG